MEHLNSLVFLAQAVPLPVDVSDIVKLGPGYALAVYMVYLWGKERDRGEKMQEAHKLEMAAERARVDKTTEQRIEDHKVLIPLASSMTTTSQSMVSVMEQVAKR